MMKLAQKPTAARYDDFKMMKSEIGKLKNENKLRKIKEPKNNEAMALLEKEKLCRDISRHGTLYLFFEQSDEKWSNQITFDSEKQITLKHQLHFRQIFNLTCQNMEKKYFEL